MLWFRARHASFLVMLLGAVGQAGPLMAQSGAIRVEEVARLGSSIPMGSPFELAHVSAMTQFPDSSLWVLDRIWPKIVGFDPTGQPVGAIPLTKGEGPGEVANPIDLTHVGDLLALLDHGLGRVTFFTRTGELVETVRLESGAAWRFAVTEDRIWTTKASLPSGSSSLFVVYEHDRQGSLIGRRETNHPDDLIHGAGLAFGVDDASILTTAKTPGAFWRHGRLSSARWGSYADPELKPWRNADGMLVIPFQVPAIGIGPSGLVAQHWYQFSDGSKMLEPRVQGLVVSNRAGERIAWSELPDDVPLAPSYSYISPITGHLHIPVNDVMPVIIVYRIRLANSP